MADYSQGKIYRLDSENGTYIGSTTTSLENRLYDHRASLRSYNKGKVRFITSHVVVDAPDLEISLIENYPCKTRQELLVREKYWINFYAERMEIVNKCLPIREEGDKQAYHKAYYERIKDTEEYKEQQKQAYERKKATLTDEKKQEINQKVRELYANNPDSLEKRRATTRRYQEKNRDELNRKKREKRAQGLYK